MHAKLRLVTLDHKDAAKAALTKAPYCPQCRVALADMPLQPAANVCKSKQLRTVRMHGPHCSTAHHSLLTYALLQALSKAEALLTTDH